MEIEIKIDLKTGEALTRVPNAAGVDEQTARARLLELEQYLQSQGIDFEYDGKIERHSHGPEQTVVQTRQQV